VFDWRDEKGHEQTMFLSSLAAHHSCISSNTHGMIVNEHEASAVLLLAPCPCIFFVAVIEDAGSSTQEGDRASRCSHGMD
jgi:hypothetical protein